MKGKPGRKPDETVEHDRLRSIVHMIADQPDTDLSKLVREAGFDTSAKEGRAAYQAINRWVGGRK